MTSYAGLDVSEQATHVCVVDAAGKVVFRGVCRTEPGALHQLLTRRAPDLGRAVLETGALASWLTHGLAALDVPVVCVCARQEVSGTPYEIDHLPPTRYHPGKRGLLKRTVKLVD